MDNFDSMLDTYLDNLWQFNHAINGVGGNAERVLDVPQVVEFLKTLARNGITVECQYTAAPKSE